MNGPRFVLEASATLAWAFDEDGNGETFGSLIKDATPVVPWLWPLEITNAILAKERRNVVSRAEATQLLSLDQLGIEVVDEPGNQKLAALAQLARSHGLTSYDATYLDLAITLALPLLTTNTTLQQAATACGVPLLWSPPSSA